MSDIAVGRHRMIHKNLNAGDIRKLVSESASIRSVGEGVHGLLEDLHKVVMSRFTKGKRLAPKELREIFEGVDKVMTSKMAPAGRWVAEVGATRVHPKGEKMEAAYVFVHNLEKLHYHLFGLRIEGSRKKVKFELTALPFAFEYHAAERFLEFRKNAEKPTNPMQAIANRMMDCAFFLFFGLPAAQDRNGGHMNIPAPDDSGLFLGHFVEYEPYSHVREYGEKSVHWGSNPSILAECPVYVLKTFVDRHRLRSDQLAAMEMMAEWHEKYRPELTKERDKIVWPEASPLLAKAWTEPSNEATLNQMMLELLGIMTDERFQRGISPHKDFAPTISEDDWLGKLVKQVGREGPSSIHAGDPTTGTST